MINPRKYGSPPYKLVVIHGGPGAPGYMAPVARELSKQFGVIEPLQTKDSIDGQIEELKHILNENAEIPLTLIGHSWGGFLSLIFTTIYPQLVNKLILIGSGPFEEKYLPLLKENRSKRLSEKEIKDTKKVENGLYNSDKLKHAELLEKLAKLSSRSDSYNPIPANSEVIEYQPDVHNKVWGEAKEMRKEGQFLEMIEKINCPVIGIHGDYDPHPFEAVKEPFLKYKKDFQFYLLKKCGHYPWLEKNAKDKFYEILNKILI